MIEVYLLFMEESNQVLLVGGGSSAHSGWWTLWLCPPLHPHHQLHPASEKAKQSGGSTASYKAMAQTAQLVL